RRPDKRSAIRQYCADGELFRLLSRGELPDGGWRLIRPTKPSHADKFDTVGRISVAPSGNTARMASYSVC
ncbi:hypothetical protein, partial [Kosakonia cowanii]|uniref:hypothetical protein n=1 Tax=Kosakonia cowanii TaxID=208223 RepID=UPI00289F5CF4